MLKYAISSGILDINVVRDSMLNEQKQHYLSLHKYAIFQDKKDGRWKTTIPDQTKKNGRRLIARTKREDLEQVIVECYSDLETNPYRINSDVTLEEIYPIWLQSRLLEVKSNNTVKKNDQDWRRYYKGTDIIKIPMKNLSVNQLRDWAHKIIDDNQLNKRDFYNMIIIMKKCFEYVSDENICDNTWSKVKINTKKLKRIEKKTNDTQIYFMDEKMKIVKHCLIDFLDNPWNISDLAIPFLFITGMRIGELVALKYDDIVNDEIIINKSEVNNYQFDSEQDKFVYAGKKVVDHAKTDAGIRTIPCTKGAKKLIEMIQISSEKYNYYDDGYIFCPRGSRMHSDSIDSKIYRICEKIGIPKKSAHKIRKTYISQIIKNGVDLDTVCRISGHVDLKTTFNSYLFCLEKKEEVYDKFNDMFKDVQDIIV